MKQKIIEYNKNIIEQNKIIKTFETKSGKIDTFEIKLDTFNDVINSPKFFEIIETQKNNFIRKQHEGLKNKKYLSWYFFLINIKK